MRMSALKHLVKTILRSAGYSLPHGLAAAGQGSKIAFPRTILGSGCISIGEGTLIQRGAEIQAIERMGGQQFTPRIKIGSRIYIGQRVCIASINAVTIEDLCVLSDHVYVSDASHGMNPLRGPIVVQPWESRGPVTIGASTFIGYRAIILPGVTLGKHCVVAAGAVVTRSFPDYSMVAGVPAKLTKSFCVESGLWVNSPSGAIQ